METIYIIDKALEVYCSSYPDDNRFINFVTAVKRYVEGELTLKQLTTARNEVSKIAKDLYTENNKCYNAIYAAVYASYTLTKRDHVKVTDEDINSALRYSLSFANKAGIK